MFLCFCDLFDIRLGKDSNSELEKAVMVELLKKMRYLDYEKAIALQSSRCRDSLCSSSAWQFLIFYFLLACYVLVNLYLVERHLTIDHKSRNEKWKSFCIERLKTKLLLSFNAKPFSSFMAAVINLKMSFNKKNISEKITMRQEIRNCHVMLEHNESRHLFDCNAIACHIIQRWEFLV